ncbi:MAG: hypothetical protein RL199_1972 [Pseudomonadota bacterium]|jgi:uncharacterized protein (DUF1501 family)
MTEHATWTRRDLLTVLGQAAGGLAAASTVFGGLDLLARPARAQSLPTGGNKERYYVFVYFGGGWDVLLGIDPRDPARFPESLLRQTQIQPGYSNIVVKPVGNPNVNVVQAGGITFGPFIGELSKHASRLALVRGMSMDTLSHEVGKRRFITGKPPSGLLARGSSATTWLASRLGRDEPIAQLAVGLESYNVDQPSYASAMKVNSVTDLLRALKPGTPALDARVAAQIDAHLAEEAACPGPARSALRVSAESARGRAHDMTTKGLSSAFDFLQNTPQMVALRSQYGITSDLSRPAAQAALAARALMTGVSRCVSITIGAGLDTHGADGWTRSQGSNQEAAFTAISRLADDLLATEFKGTGTSWLDHTTIVGFSEFSRTPMLNDQGGRDHHLANSCLLLGGSIKGGTVIGATSDVGMMPQPVNLATGLVDPGGELLKPEHVLRTLYEDVGIGDEADMRAQPIRAMLRS